MLIKIVGKNTITKEQTGLKITDAYVPVNAMSFQVDQSINLNLATPQFPIIIINSISLNQSRYVYIVDATFY